jgi:hypothetical protein
MPQYPEILLPKKNYPVLVNAMMNDCALVRETLTDLYVFLAKQSYGPDDILRFVVAPQPSLREVFELSVFLYGYYDERHIGIRAADKSLYADWKGDLPELKAEDIQFSKQNVYPLFLAASKLDNQEIDFNGERHTLSFSHKPTRVNYWHFELWIRDSAGNRIPKDKSNARTKYLAKSILEYIVAEAVIPQSNVKPFNRADFDKVTVIQGGYEK